MKGLWTDGSRGGLVKEELWRPAKQDRLRPEPFQTGATEARLSGSPARQPDQTRKIAIPTSRAAIAIVAHVVKATKPA
jgi:hypothetical protein